MTKKTKDFSGELDNIMQGMAQTQPTPQQKEGANQNEKAEAKRGRPRNPNAAQQQRATFIIDKELLQEIKRISYKETAKQYRSVTQTEIIEDALRAYITKYNKK